MKRRNDAVFWGKREYECCECVHTLLSSIGSFCIAQCTRVRDARRPSRPSSIYDPIRLQI